jgi:Metal-sensitive transcriptional repressor
LRQPPVLALLAHDIPPQTHGLRRLRCPATTLKGAPAQRTTWASEKVALILLEDHVEHCVREAIEDDEKAAELGAAVERFLRV